MSKKKTFKDFINEYVNKHGKLKYFFDESTFINSHTPIRIICPKHGEFWKSPKNIMNYDCIKCSYELRGNNFKYTTEEFIEKAKKIHGDKYDYSKVNYNGAKIKVCIICPEHGEFWQIPNDHLCNKGCKLCNESHLEKKAKQILTENNIKYIYQYRPSWLNKQSLDFYLPDYNIAIECQGKQHFNLGGWSKNFDFNKQINIDIKKYNLVTNNNIKLLYFTDKIFLNKIENKFYENKIFDINKLILCIQENK